MKRTTIILILIGLFIMCFNRCSNKPIKERNKSDSVLLAIPKGEQLIIVDSISNTLGTKNRKCFTGIIVNKAMVSEVEPFGYLTRGSGLFDHNKMEEGYVLERQRSLHYPITTKITSNARHTPNTILMASMLYLCYSLYS